MVIWTDPAKADLHHIYNFIAEDSKQYAHNVAKKLIEKTETLNEIPNIGKVVPEIKDENVRELHLYSYRIIYEIKEQNIEVLAVIHKRRNFKPSELDK